ncbi:hypothetical protein LY76DRAFT_289722 [Colletotrichum caudatum]|nr:hypothetical protein LY76DRAFT_289722 [Colletotrichum caudatum]
MDSPGPGASWSIDVAWAQLLVWLGHLPTEEGGHTKEAQATGLSKDNGVPIGYPSPLQPMSRRRLKRAKEPAGWPWQSWDSYVNTRTTQCCGGSSFGLCTQCSRCMVRSACRGNERSGAREFFLWTDTSSLNNWLGHITHHLPFTQLGQIRRCHRNM